MSPIETDPARRVDFLMLGCPRCGTTWVDSALRSHPEVYLPAQKQTYFFDQTYSKGFDWYLSQFEGRSPAHKVAGEIATQYYLPKALARVVQHFPDIKVMMAMRNPAERAYSFYQSRRVTAGWTSFRQAIEQMPAILEGGLYAEHLERVLDHYPRERVLMLFYDDLVGDDRRYLRSVLEFIGVTPDFESPQFGRLVQVAAFPRIRQAMRQVGLGGLVDLVSSSVAGDILRRYLKRANVRRYPAMSDADWAFVRDYYANSNQRLAQLSGRDLSHWAIRPT